MKKHILIKLFLLLLPITFWGQNYLISESIKDTEKFISELRTAKIDTILVYKEYCTGCDITSITKEPMYEEGFLNTHIIWLKNEKAFAKKFSYPNIDEKVNQINIIAVLDYFYEHKKEFNSINEYYKQHKKFPQNPVHDYYEELIIMTQNNKELIILSEDQKSNEFWLKFTWIPPSKKIMELIRNKLN
jgi:hypothetical protein